MSSLLRGKSLVHKSTHGHKEKDGQEISPVDTLLDRNQQWKHVTKSLLNWAQGMSSIEKDTAKATLHLCDTIQVPFHEGHAFTDNGGWQETLYAVRDNTKRLSELHSSLATTLDKTVVQELEGVRSEIKAHIAAIEKEAGVLQTEVTKERATSAQHLTQLQQGIDTFENSSDHMLPQHDPYITHSQVSKQLTKQLHKENDLTTALIRFQQQQPSFEAGISKSIQSAVKMYDEAKLIKAKDIAAVEAEIQAAIQQVDPEVEYNHFKKLDGYVLDPNTPLRSLDNVSFPGLDHPSSKPIKEGYLERKKRFTKSYKEAYYVLTPSGYLHERKSNDDDSDIKPVFSLFLPECSLSAPAKETAKSHKIHVEGNKAVKSKVEGKMKHSLRFGGKEIAYSFRGRTHADMMGWWEAMDQLSRDTKSEPVVAKADRKPVSPVAAAVANVGYADTTNSAETEQEHPAPTTATTTSSEAPTALTSEHAAVAPVHHEEEEEDDEEGGSSAEEEEEEERARTAPSTPAVHSDIHQTSPLDAVSHAEGPAEVLPVYAGDGSTTAEQQAALGEKKSALGGASSGSTPGLPPVASTSHTSSS